jgi:hypothetical protein
MIDCMGCIADKQIIDVQYNMDHMGKMSLWDMYESP